MSFWKRTVIRSTSKGDKLKVTIFLIIRKSPREEAVWARGHNLYIRVCFFRCMSILIKKVVRQRPILTWIYRLDISCCRSGIALSRFRLYCHANTRPIVDAPIPSPLIIQVNFVLSSPNGSKRWSYSMRIHRNGPLHFQFWWSCNSVTRNSLSIPLVSLRLPTELWEMSPDGESLTSFMCLAQLGHSSIFARWDHEVSIEASTINSRLRSVIMD